MDLGLADKVVAVTGGARGLGLAIVRAFLAEGAVVVSVDRAHTAESPADAENNDRMRLIEADIATEAGAGAAVDAAIDAFGRLDILVCNAARYSNEPLSALSHGEWMATQSTNVGGAAFAIKKAVDAGMKDGAVVIVGSTATKSVQANEFSYRASKMALWALTQSAALELCDDGIRVNLVTPGAINTAFASANEEGRQRALRAIPMGREAEPAEIAKAVLFLASDAASYITGSELLIDGGLSMRPIR